MGVVFIAYSFLIISSVVAVSASNNIILYASCASLAPLLLLIYFYTFYVALRPAYLFKIYTKLFSSVRSHTEGAYKADIDVRGLPVARFNEDQLKKWTNSLEATVLFNRLALFSAKKLRIYQNSSVHLISGLLTTGVLFIITIFSFAAINYAIFNIDHSYFSSIGNLE